MTLEKSDNSLFTAIIEDWTEREEIKDLKFALSRCSVVSVVNVAKNNYKRGWNDYIKTTFSNIHTLHTHNTLHTLHTHTTHNIPKEQQQLYKRLFDSGITGRNLEISFPLLITAQTISSEVFEDILKIIQKKVSSKREDEYFGDKDVMLYDFIAHYDKTPFQQLLIRQILYDLRDYSDIREDWLNESWLGRALIRLNLVLGRKRTNRGISVTLNTSKAKEKLKMFKNPEKNEILPYPKGQSI
jgi:hypothetical protein